MAPFSYSLSAACLWMQSDQQSYPCYHHAIPTVVACISSYIVTLCKLFSKLLLATYLAVSMRKRQQQLIKCHLVLPSVLPIQWDIDGLSQGLQCVQLEVNEAPHSSDTRLVCIWETEFMVGQEVYPSIHPATTHPSIPLPFYPLIHI